MSAEPTTIEKLQGLRWAIFLNVANQFFVHFIYFGSAFVLFLDQLGISKAGIGFVLSLAPFANALALIIAPFAARFGYKRTFVIFFFARKTVTILLLLTPWMVNRFGTGAAFTFVAGVVALFATVRAIEETAYNPWYQEFVPKSMLGKYAAINNIFTAVAGVVAVSIASYVINQSDGLSGFMWLIGAGILAGYISAWSAIFIPGGAPSQVDRAAQAQPRNLGAALRDRDFLLYLLGLTCITFGTAPIASFLPLYLQEQAGLSSGIAVLVQIGTMMGSIVSSFLWGWASDRYGSRPVTLTGVLLLFVMPLLWWSLPMQAPWNLPLALLFAFGQGVANLGWGIGAGRMLFASIVPADKKADYLALWFAWAGIAAGISQLAGGWFLDLTRTFQANLWGLPFNGYSLLFLLSAIVLALTVVLISPIRSDSTVSMGQFAGLFVHGNPITAFGSLIRFHRATVEHDTILMTEQLGQAKSMLTVDELLETLDDPRFNVRFEAILAISRMPPNPRLIKALITILEGDTPALSAIAAWALGRIGDEEALEPLRRGLSAGYRSIQAHCARSLGALGDQAAAAILQARLGDEEDATVRIAFATTLGMLGVEQAAGPLLSLLEQNTTEQTRFELALSLVRILDDEGHFIQLWRATRSEPGNAIAQELTNIKRKVERQSELSPDLKKALTHAIESFAHNDLQNGVTHLRLLLALYPISRQSVALKQMRRECMAKLLQYTTTRMEYTLLAIHLLRKLSLTY